jgi:hypothetical protein
MGRRSDTRCDSIEAQHFAEGSETPERQTGVKSARKLCQLRWIDSRMSQSVSDDDPTTDEGRARGTLEHSSLNTGDLGSTSDLLAAYCH